MAKKKSMLNAELQVCRSEPASYLELFGWNSAGIHTFECGLWIWLFTGAAGFLRLRVPVAFRFRENAQNSSGVIVPFWRLVSGICERGGGEADQVHRVCARDAANGQGGHLQIWRDFA
eukprot:6177737-Pleurochrysis_carterae.AAC.2